MFLLLSRLHDSCIIPRKARSIVNESRFYDILTANYNTIIPDVQYISKIYPFFLNIYRKYE